MYINTQTLQYPISRQEIVEQYPNTSFPIQFNEFENFAFVSNVDMPTYNLLLQTCVEGNPSKQSDGSWVQTWVVTDKYSTQAEIDAAIAAENQKKIEGKSAIIRNERNKLLQESDWIVIKSFESNQNIPAAWEIYRQALRDIPQQAGFPDNVVWPEKP